MAGGKLIREGLEALSQFALPLDFKAAKMARDRGKIEGVVKNALPEALARGTAAHKEGRLPVPLGDRMLPSQNSGDVNPWVVTGHYVDPIDPRRFGYDLQNPETGETYRAMASDPRLGLRSLQGWTPMGIKSP